MNTTNNTSTANKTITIDMVKQNNVEQRLLKEEKEMLETLISNQKGMLERQISLASKKDWEAKKIKDYDTQLNAQNFINTCNDQLDVLRRIEVQSWSR